MATDDHQATLVDQAARDRFVFELGQNFSVMASAGAGKTTAIVSRVIQFALEDAQRDESRLPSLTVVTYGEAAAKEMRRRAAAALRKCNASPLVQARFQQAYFGTIHSFCLELLRAYGPLAGLSPRFKVSRDVDSLWRTFLRASDTILHPLAPEIQRAFARLTSPPKALGLVTKFGAQIPQPTEPEPAPEPDFDPVFQFQPTRRNEKNVRQGQRLAREWLEAWNGPVDSPCPPPTFTQGGKDFQAVWTGAWRPLMDWLGEVCHYLAASLADEFREFRIARGEILFNDMIALAARLVQHPSAGASIRESGRVVILDEAQDTDWLQFFILLTVSGAHWQHPESLSIEEPPPPGRFCQVGDPQQAIYGSRADPRVYRAIHSQLIGLNGADALTFRVTMRCDCRIADAANLFFPNILKSADESQGQARFVALSARPGAGPGSVERVRLEPHAALSEKPNADECLSAECDAIGKWLLGKTEADFGVTDWSQVAILAVRNRWLDALSETLEKVGLPVQAHSRAEVRGSDPCWAWTAALVRILSEPEDRFEQVGVLREVFGLSDSVIAHHFRGERQESVQKVVDLIGAIRRAVIGAPLDEAFRAIVQAFQLESRLCSLPTIEGKRVLRPLETIRNHALLAEERGLSLADWSNELFLMLAEVDDAEEVEPGHLQLLTCHKSKGLQWPVVIVPMLRLDFSRPSENYPVLYPAGPGRPSAVAFDKAALLDRKAEASVADRLENARLAYVTWTRARQRLLFVDAAAVAPGRASITWAGTWSIDAKGANDQAWASLPDFRASAAHGGQPPPQPEPTDSLLLSAPPNGTVEQTPVFPRRILPSSLAQHHRRRAGRRSTHERDELDRLAEPGYPEVLVPVSGAGADYGNWWHETMEAAPWGEPETVWHDFFLQMRADCPDADRSAREFEKLLETEMFGWINSPGRIVRPETPVLWAPEPNKGQQRLDLFAETHTPAYAFDGFIDLLVDDGDANRCCVIDWKTDRVTDQAAVELTACYGNQIRAYVQALTAIFERPVEGWLYSTHAGIWVPVETE